MMTYTFELLPVGQIGLNLEGFTYLPDLFATVLVFAMKLALPVVAVEIIIAMSVGIIMRIIPQINVFVLSIQFKLFAGLFMLVILVGPVIAYFGNMILISFEHLQEAIGVMFQLL
jgi:flagellar biosynthetic protein FliR